MKVISDQIFRNIQTPTIVATFLVSVAVLSFFMPRSETAGISYELDRPWRYDPLIAPYDFPVIKTAEEFKAEQDSALAYFYPFFDCSVATGEQQVQRFESDFRRGAFANVSPAYRAHIATLLNEVYEAGILSWADLDALRQKNVKGLRIVEGQSATARETTELFSTRSAYDYIMQADTIHFPRNMMTRCNVHDYLAPNLVPDTGKTATARRDLLAAISSSNGLVQAGEKIIDRGEIINAERLKILDSYVHEQKLRGEKKATDNWQLAIGQILFNAAVLTIFLVFLYMFCRTLLRQKRNIFLIFSLITIFPLITHLMVGHHILSVYILPYAMVGIFLRIFTDTRTAVMGLLTTVVLSSVSLNGPYEFLLIETIAGLAAIIGINDLTERSQLVRVVLCSTCAMLVFDLIFDLAQGTTLARLDHTHYIYIFIGGVALLFAYPMLYLLERVFGFTSSVTLVELTNINNSLLTRLSKEAPGTFQHSMQVANLASEVAVAIGAQSQLVRTGAFYHDIGKLSNPIYFTENQSGVNPHDQLNDERESARIIISHVTEGLKMAEKYSLPTAIRQFIATHHGRGKVKYFHIQWLNRHPGEQGNEEAFTYPGPNPFTKEQAVLMMCDAVEASSRSLKDYSPQSISELVSRIIDSQLNDGYFKRCPISFLDIEIAKRTLVESLKKVYHTRIAYPELNKPAAQPDEAPARPAEVPEGEGGSRHNGFFRRRW